MNPARLFFGLMYRVGFTPWEGHPVPAKLRELTEGANALPKGRALDVGCGTGDMSIFLAQHGWDVTAIDFVETAVARARKKVDAAGARVRLVRADVTKLRAIGIAGPFSLLVDNGCLHGLDDDARDAYVREMSAVAAPGARLVLMAFPASNRKPGPRGIDASEIERRFASGWRVLSSGAEPTVSKDHPRWAEIRFYELERLA